MGGGGGGIKMRGNCEVDDGKKLGFAHFIYGHEGGGKTVNVVFNGTEPRDYRFFS